LIVTDARLPEGSALQERPPEDHFPDFTFEEGLGAAKLLCAIIFLAGRILELMIELTPEFPFTLLNARQPESSRIEVPLKPIPAILKAFLPIKGVSR
jgi:hypothetical protein